MFDLPFIGLSGRYDSYRIVSQRIDYYEYTTLNIGYRSLADIWQTKNNSGDVIVLDSGISCIIKAEDIFSDYNGLVKLGIDYDKFYA